MNNANKKRLYPPVWQHDYHVLTALRTIMQRYADTYWHGKKGTIVDYGCGSSPYKYMFRGNDTDYIAVDIGKNPEADMLIGEGEKIKMKDGSVDIVLSTQVLEHVDDVRFYLSESARILKKNGYLFLSTHGIWPYHPYPIDCHRWTKTGLEREIIRHGFTVIADTPILGPVAASVQWGLLYWVGQLLTMRIIGRLLIPFISLIGNGRIWIREKLNPVSQSDGDAAVFVICAKKK